MNKIFKYSLPIGIAGIVLNVILFATNFYYELVIPVFEKTMEDGAAFTFIDNLVFFTPVIFIVLFAAYLIAGQIYLKKQHLETEQGVTEEHKVMNAAQQRELDEKLEFVKRKYHTNCPNCGSARAEDEAACRFCGTSLIITKTDNADK